MSVCDVVRTADSVDSLIEGVETLAGARLGGAAGTRGAVRVVIATHVVHATTRSQLSLSHYTNTHTTQPPILGGTAKVR